ncbi:MAG: hypothetical protein RLZ35_1035 [Pseudomonadota bacterium]
MNNKLQKIFIWYQKNGHARYVNIVHQYPVLKYVTWFLLAFFLYKGISSLYSHYHAKNGNKLVVQAVNVEKKAMPVLIKAPGTISAIHTVSIIPQVTGTIKEIAIDRGANVSKGQLLFQIDPAPFLETLRQAKATLMRDESTLIQNQADAKRYADLVKKEYVTRQQAEQAATIATAQMALVEADKAQVEQAEIQLEYTRIRAPISGRTGDFSINIGDLVVANSDKPILVINTANPVWVTFSLNQSQLTSVRHYQQNNALTVHVYSDADDNTPLGSGELSLIDNVINSQSGTVLMKGKIENPDNILWPGMMVNAELVLTIEHDALVIPGNAIQFDQSGHFVYCIEQGKAIVKRVVVSRQIKDLAVIQQGLIGDEKVITTIAPDLREGSPVYVEHVPS